MAPIRPWALDLIEHGASAGFEIGVEPAANAACAWTEAKSLSSSVISSTWANASYSCRRSIGRLGEGEPRAPDS